MNEIFCGANETPQNDIPLAVFLAICDQSLEKPAPSHDALWHQEELAAYAQVISDACNRHIRNITLLEVGCGTGRIGPYLAKISGVAHYEGIDVVDDYLAYFKQHSPSLRLFKQNIFHLEEDEAFDVILLPFTTLHLFSFELQEALITKLLTKHTSTACFDVMLPDWGGILERFTWKQPIVVEGVTALKESYALARKDYQALAEKLQVTLTEKLYTIRNTDGKFVTHALLTFHR